MDDTYAEVNKAILERAIAKAISKGWDMKPDDIKVNFDQTISVQIFKDKWLTFGYETIVFGLPFARALWGEGPVLKTLDKTDYHPSHNVWTLPDADASIAWQYHLQQLAIAEDRSKYLNENVVG